MREPLNSFANRIVNNQEVVEFIVGLVKEKGVNPIVIIRAVQGAPQSAKSPFGRTINTPHDHRDMFANDEPY
jgi:hypothetical protein